MSKEELLQPRYKVIADYPCAMHNVGDIIPTYESAMSYAVKIDEVSDKICLSDYPTIFKKLEWWQERTLDELMSVNYVKITIYTGYWRVGDVINVTDYKIDTKNKKLLMYILDGTQQSLPERCEPATLEEYKADKAKRSGRNAE